MKTPPAWRQIVRYDSAPRRRLHRDQGATRGATRVLPQRPRRLDRRDRNGLDRGAGDSVRHYGFVTKRGAYRSRGEGWNGFRVQTATGTASGRRLDIGAATPLRCCPATGRPPAPPPLAVYVPRSRSRSDNEKPGLLTQPGRSE